MVHVEPWEPVSDTRWSCARGAEAILQRYNRRKICSAKGRLTCADLRARHKSGGVNIQRLFKIIKNKLI